MKVVGIAGFSGSGKTTLVERMIPQFTLAGLRVSVIKHAHHRFDIDHPGKDTWRHREAGAREVVVASSRRLAVMRELDEAETLGAHQLIAELRSPADWVLVEGFKQSDLPKLEVWRQDHGKPARYAQDAHIMAIATDSPLALPSPTALPVLDLNDPQAVVQWLTAHAAAFEYTAQSPHET